MRGLKVTTIRNSCNLVKLMKPSLEKLIKIIFKTFKHKKTAITNHEAYNKYLVMICGKMIMKYGKVWKYY